MEISVVCEDSIVIVLFPLLTVCISHIPQIDVKLPIHGQSEDTEEKLHINFLQYPKVAANY